MSSNRPISDYDPVAPAAARRSRRQTDETGEDVWTRAPTALVEDSAPPRQSSVSTSSGRAQTKDRPFLKRGHAVSYAGLFLFTTFLYFRPYELIPALSSLSSAAFYIAIFTLAVFIPTQLVLEGTLTIRPREIKLVALLTLCALVSIPLAINRGEAWETFVEYLKVVLMFIVMMNVVRTERRLKLLLLLVLSASVMVSVGALSDYRAGNLTVRGERVGGIIGGMFGNPNDLALHLATMIPITFGLLLSTSGILKKLIYIGGALLMGAALVVTFSRGGFLGMVAASSVLAWKLGRRHRVVVIGVLVAVLVLFLAFAPGEYAGRLASIVGKPDVTGSSNARQALLVRSISTTIKNPLLGVGMGNFHIVSIHEQVSHNAYTQVGAEMGVAAMIIYTLFVFTPLKRLRRIERETFVDHIPVRRAARDYYLAVCLQASVIGYIVSSFFGSVAYLWYIYYLVAYAFCFARIHEARTAAGDTEAHAKERTREKPGRRHAFGDGAEAVESVRA